MSYKVGIEINATDQATPTLNDVQEELNETGRAVSKANDEVARSQKQVSFSAAESVKSFSALATSAWALYQGYDNLQDAQLGIDKANLQVKTSAQNAQEAQDKLNKAIEKYGEDSPEAIKAAEDLAIAEEKHGIAVDRAKMLQDNLREATVSFALGTIPTAITMITQLTDKKNILGAAISGLIEKLIGSGGLNSALGTVGSTAGGLGPTLSTAIGGAGTTISGIIGGAGATTAGAMAATAGVGAALVLGPALLAEALATEQEKQAWQIEAIASQREAMDVSRVLEDLASGALVSQHGFVGWVQRPTLFLAGEAGPEHIEITPSGRGRVAQASFNTNVYVGTVNHPADEERLARVIADRQLSEMLRRGRL